jgi:hypothetical protein
MKNLDLIASNVDLFYRGNKKYKSKVGGMLSIFLYTSSLVCFLIYFIQFFKKGQWESINKITTTDSTDWEPFEIKVLHKSPKFEDSFQELYYQMNEIKMTFFNKSMKCTYQEMQEMEMEPDPNYNFYCFKFTEFFSHSIKKRCYHTLAALMKTNCFENERNITVRFLSYYLDSEKISKPIKRFHDVKEIYKKKNQIFVTYNKLIDDTNYFFQNEEVSYFSEVWFQEDMNQFWDQGTYTLTPLVDVIPLQKLIISRKTSKFNDVLAKILGIMQLISIILDALHKFFYIEFSFNYKQLNWWFEKEEDLPELGLHSSEYKSMGSLLSKKTV